MFTPGRIVFAICFLVVFVVGMIYAFRKDKAVNTTHYKGAYKVFFIMAGVVIFYVLLVRILKMLS